MLSLNSFDFGKETDVSGGAAGQRPEILRRKTLAINSAIATLACLLGLPVALFALMQGLVLPFVVAIAGLAGAVATLGLYRQAEYELAARGQVLLILGVGVLIATAQPAIINFGVAMMLLAPIHAGLVTTGRFRKLTWVLAAACLPVAYGLTWSKAQTPEIGVIAGFAFAVAGIMVAHSASGLNAAFSKYDRARDNAYRHLIENVQDAVMRFSSSGEVLFTSRSSETLLGCRRYELTATGVVERLHVLDRPNYLTAFAAANQDGQARTIEVRMRRDDPHAGARPPQFIWVEVTLSPVVDPELAGLRCEVVALFRDITARKDHENELRAARRAAEDASNAKSRFLATIGHELRTPLNAIVGFSEMMTCNIGGELSSAHRDYAGMIHKSGHHLLDVVSMLLDMSRIEAGKFELQNEAFEPAGLMEPCLQMVQASASERGITLDVDMAEELPMLMADERACRQIVINLLSNAIKFSHDGGVIKVSMKRLGNNLAIAVTDEGIGMAHDSVARIGEPFFQAQEGLGRRYEGTGLGLSIVKGLIDLHKGRIRIISELGKGTTVTVFLPINAPAIKVSETANVTALHREPILQQTTPWQEDLRRKAQ